MFMKPRIDLNSLGGKIILRFILPFVLIPFLSGFYIVVKNISSDIERTEERYISQQAAVVVKLLQEAQNSLIGTTEANAHWTEFYNALTNNDVQFIKEDIDFLSNGDMADFNYTLNKQGDIVSRNSKIPDIRLDTGAMLSLASKDARSYAGFADTGHGLAMVCIASALDNDGNGYEQSPGYLIVGKMLGSDLLGEIKKVTGCEVTVWLPGKQILSTRQFGDVSELENIWARVHKSGKGVVLQENTANGLYYRSGNLLSSIDGKPLALLLVENKGLDLAERLNTYLVTGLLVIVAIAVIMLKILQGIVQKPVGRIIGYAEDYARGDFSSSIDIDSRDEIGRLAGALNKMVVDLRDLVKGIMETSRQLAQDSHSLAAASEEIKTGIEHVAVTTEDVARTSQQSENLSEDAFQRIEQMRRLAEEMEKRTGETVVKINQVSEANSKTIKAVNGLIENTRQINQFAEVIAGISGQTNLLALNAAIEAARAGEQGRGFAVVADEIRKLAEQAGRAVAEIKELAKLVLQVSDDVVLAMDNGKRQISEGVTMVQDTGQAVENIIKGIKEAAGLTRSAAQSVRQSSEGTRQLAQAYNQVKSTIQQMALLAENLAEVADTLQQKVERFNV